MLLMSLIFGVGEVLAQEVPPIDVVLLCTNKKGDKTIGLFKQGNNFIYQYGSDLGKPELQLVRAESSVIKQPWNGVGREFWNNITLENKGYSYTIRSAYERSENGSVTAGVNISKGDKYLTSVECKTTSNFIDNLASFAE